MEKKEFQKIARDKLKSEGFRVRGNYCYKRIDEDYLVFITLDHSPYHRGYYIEYGGLYSREEIPPWWDSDWNERFLFTENPDDDLEKYNIENLRYMTDGLVECFEYENREPEDFLRQLDINLKKKLVLIEDKEFILSYYRENINELARFPDDDILKLLRYCDFDRDEINAYRKKWGYPKYDF